MKDKPILEKIDSNEAHGPDLAFWCPGCKTYHGVWVRRRPQGPFWNWNGDMVHPTFDPSLKVTSQAGVCHSFVRNGKIEFLADCWHELRGQTVDLMPAELCFL